MVTAALLMVTIAGERIILMLTCAGQHLPLLVRVYFSTLEGLGNTAAWLYVSHCPRVFCCNFCCLLVAQPASGTQPAAEHLGRLHHQQDSCLLKHHTGVAFDEDNPSSTPVCVGDVCVVHSHFLEPLICTNRLQVRLKCGSCQGNCEWQVKVWGHIQPTLLICVCSCC